MPNSYFSVCFLRCRNAISHSELFDSSLAARSFLPRWVVGMLGDRAFSVRHLLESCPRLWRLLLPSRSQPYSSRLLEVRSLSNQPGATPLPGYRCPYSQIVSVSRKMLPPPPKSWCKSWDQPLCRAEAAPLLMCRAISPSACKGRGNGGVLPAWPVPCRQQQVSL